MILCFLLLSLSPFLSRAYFNSSELSPYECGFEPIGSSHVVFCMKFFLLALLFLVFDVEVSFLVPALHSSTLLLSFIFILLLGLSYEYSYGGLDWVV